MCCGCSKENTHSCALGWECQLGWNNNLPVKVNYDKGGSTDKVAARQDVNNHDEIPRGLKTTSSDNSDESLKTEVITVEFLYITWSTGLIYGWSIEYKHHM